MKIPLNQNKYALIDKKDFSILSNFNWCVNDKGYVCTRMGKKVIKMHRFLMNPTKKQEVDHINGNTLDNRRQNLRSCSKSQNQRNRKVNKNSKNGYKGVTLHSSGLWSARISTNNGRKFLGYFYSPYQAAQIYNENALKYHGEYAKLNN